jgi:hypothetical protein
LPVSIRDAAVTEWLPAHSAAGALFRQRSLR